VVVQVRLGLQHERRVGAGIVLSRSGLVLTSNDVVKGATAIAVFESEDGRSYSATVVGYSTDADIAVLKLQAASGLPAARLGGSAKVLVGEKTTGVAVAPSGKALTTVAAERVVAVNQSVTAADASTGSAERISGLIRTSVSLSVSQPGRGGRITQSSRLIVPGPGGPLLDSEGRVIGLDAASSATAGFAIPIGRADAVAQAILDGRSSATVHVGATAFLGVSVSNPHPGLQYRVPGARAGVVIEGVLPGSPGQGAGLAAGDTITSLDGHEVTSVTTLADALFATLPGQRVRIAWTDRAGTSHRSTVRLAAGPAQ
jgi:S1-C subfamily serine protease